MRNGFAASFPLFATRAYWLPSSCCSELILRTPEMFKGMGYQYGPSNRCCTTLVLARADSASMNQLASSSL